MTEDFIERRIITGLIVSTAYLQQIFTKWNPRLLTSPSAERLAGWCLEYFRQYGKAPGKDIEGIYHQKLREGLPRDRADWIGEILEHLSTEYERGQFNDQYLFDQTLNYFRERHLRNLSDDIRNELDGGRVNEAEKLAGGYVPVSNGQCTYLDPFSKEVMSVVERAFAEREKPLIAFPGALGEFWNHELLRKRFIALMGPEKRGKTFQLIEMAMRGLKSGCCVAFFQAGDMTEEDQIIRLAIHLTQRSNQERYCKELLIPQLDCIYHQTDECTSNSRETSSGVVFTAEQIHGLTYDLLSEKLNEYPNHKRCYNCDRIHGAVWLTRRPPVNPLTAMDAYKALRRFQVKYKTRFRLSTYPNDTLTITEIKGLLGLWEQQDGFVPDVIIIDYADILAPDSDCRQMSSRDQQNSIWKRLRGMSQQRSALVITATQSDADSYEQELLRKKNFSEDKRKYGHVTAMWGLNQNDEEKRIGIMRINELVVREGDFDQRKPIKVLQRLQMGRAMLTSYK